jgi:hypothetical protein
MSARRPVAQTTLDAAFAFAAAQATFTVADVQLKMGVSEDLARNIVRTWREADLLELVSSGHRIRSVWAVKPGARQVLAAKARSPEQNMWTAMRQMKSGFTPRDLAAHATTEETLVTPEAAQDYCRALLGAGYLGVARKAVPGKTEAIYRLIRNTGPRAPKEKRVRAVIDSNTEETVLIGGGQ